MLRCNQVKDNKLNKYKLGGQEMFNYGIYSSCYEAAKQMEQERIKQGLREHKPVTAGCEHLEECFDEMMEV